MELIAKNGDYIKVNTETLKRISKTVKEFYVINLADGTKKYPDFVYILDTLCNENKIEDYCEMTFFSEYQKRVNKLPENTIRNRRQVLKEVESEISFGTIVIKLYKELLELSSSDELKTLKERMNNNKDNKEVLLEKQLNPNYDYEYLRKLYNLSLGEITYIKYSKDKNLVKK